MDIKMTKTTADKKTAEAVKEEAATGASKITDTAREFVKRSAASAMERSDNIYEGSTKLNSGLGLSWCLLTWPLFPKRHF